MHRLIRVALLTIVATLAPAARLHAQTPATSPTCVADPANPACPNAFSYYATGWNLVAGMGIPIAGAVGPLYTWQAGDAAYETVDPDTALTTGRGYWAYFDQPTLKTFPAGGSWSSIPLPAGQWVMVGGLPLVSANMRGADLLYTFNTSTRQYELQSGGLLVWGQGAWAYSVSGGDLSFSLPGTLPPISAPCRGLPDMCPLQLDS